MHTQMVQQNFVMDCSNVDGGVVARGLPVTTYELGLFHTTYTIFMAMKISCHMVNIQQCVTTLINITTRLD